MLAKTRTGSRARGFTLVELLVVIAIIALISAVALPSILTGLNERRVSEAARILQATLAGTRDAAIRGNGPRGIRLLPDPVLNGVNGNPLASNRMIPIEPGPDYTEGLVIILNSTTVSANSSATYYNTIYNYYNNRNSTGALGSPQFVHASANQYLMVAELDFTTYPVPSNPTSWSLNIRQGDKIRFNDAGAIYTVAGPVNGPPYSSANTPNSERVIACYPASSSPLPTQANWAPGFLFLLNGQDDNGNGWIDESCDGIDNDGDGITDPGFNGIDDDGVNGIDDPNELQLGKNFGNGPYTGTEFEPEVFLGAEAGLSSQSSTTQLAYTISRRPVVSPGGRETTLPAGVVIDLTTWNNSAIGVNALGQVLLPERSRLPVDAYTGYVDIMIDQNGRVVSSGAGADGGGTYKNSPLSNTPFYHFWLTDREDVVPPLYGPGTTSYGSPFGIAAPNPNYTSNSPAPPYNVLPMPQGLGGYTPPTNSNVPILKPYLTGERRLVTLFVKTGQISSNSIQNFNVLDTNAPYYDAQAGIKESQ